MTPWIKDWSEISDEAKYIVCAVNKGTYSYGYYLTISGIYIGYEVKRLRKGCYVARPLDEPSQELLSLEPVPAKERV